jgi:hypothetical protein
MAKKASSKKSAKPAAKAASAKESRQGRRAPTERQTSISINGETLEWARNEATADGRSFSNYVERLLERERSAAQPAKKKGK